MSHSNSSLNTFSNCMARYKYCYIDRLPTECDSVHLKFGTMAHDVLYKAGKLRDEFGLDDNNYKNVIPSDLLYNDLMQRFDITSWTKYFVPVIKQVHEYEVELATSMLEDFSAKTVEIERELKLSVSAEDINKLTSMNKKPVSQPFTGIIDLLLMDEKHTCATIIDYKFSTGRKTQDDFDMNSQLPLYSFFVHHTYGVPLHNIKYGYIDIPKQEFGKPVLLSNGTLSRAKSQNVSAEMYEQAVLAIHGDDPYYNCNKGGHYEECYNNLKLNKAAYLSVQFLDQNVYDGILPDLLDTAILIDNMVDIPYLKKYDSYSCKNCDYLKYCKPWLSVNEL